MNNGLATQIRGTFEALDDAQAPLTVEEIMHRAGPVRTLPIEEPQTVGRNWRVPVLVAAVAAAVVLIALIPVLFLNTQPDQTPATAPSTVTSTTLESAPTTTAVEEVAEAVGSISEGSSDWSLAAADWQILTFPEKIHDQFIALQTGIDQHVYNFEVEPPEYVGIKDLNGDDRAWLFRSDDGSVWTREPLPEFDGTVIRSTVEVGLLWVQHINGDLDGEGLFVSPDGDNWTTVQFDYGDGEMVTEAPPVKPYFASLRGPRFVRSGSTVIAPGWSLNKGDQALWVSADEGKTFQQTQPFDTPHARIQVGPVGEGFFAIGADSDQMIVSGANPTNPDEITYSTAYSTDGFTWTPGAPITVPYSGGGFTVLADPKRMLDGGPLTNEMALVDGPIQDGSAAVNYFLYAEPDQTIVAAQAVLVNGTVSIEEIARGNRCLHTLENSPCLPYSSMATPAMFRSDEFLISKIEDESTLIRISRDGINWEPISLDGAPFNRIAGLVTVVDGTIFHAHESVTGEGRDLWTHTP